MKAFKKPATFVVDRSVIKESALLNLLREIASSWSAYDTNYNCDMSLSDLETSECYLFVDLSMLHILGLVSSEFCSALKWWLIRTVVAPDEAPFVSERNYYYEAGEDITPPQDREQFVLDTLCDLFEVQHIQAEHLYEYKLI